MIGTTTRVFVIDEHELVRRGLIDLVATAPDLVVAGSAASLEEALTQLADDPPDVVLLEARLQGGGGVRACRELRSRHPEVRCLLIAAFDDDEALFNAVMAGAQGYVVKQTGGSYLLDGVRAVAAGQVLLDEPMTERLLARLRQAGQGDDGGRPLSDDEQQLVELVMSGRTDAQIAAATGWPGAEVGTRVAAVHAKLALRRPGGSAGEPTPWFHQEP
jgi:two-component system response regulator DevR